MTTDAIAFVIMSIEIGVIVAVPVIGFLGVRRVVKDMRADSAK